MNPFKAWMQRATKEQKTQLAGDAGSSEAALRQAAEGYRTNGQVSITAEFAARIEVAAKKQVNALPKIRREDLCQTCKECPYQKQCNNITH